MHVAALFQTYCDALSSVMLSIKGRTTVQGMVLLPLRSATGSACNAVYDMYTCRYLTALPGEPRGRQPDPYTVL